MPGERSITQAEKLAEAKLGGFSIRHEQMAVVANIYRAASAVRQHLENSVLRGADLTWTAFVVLWVVWIWDGLETRRAAEAAAISKATLTGVVKTLEARGWMEKRGREDDRRLVELRLTPAGKALMEDLYPKFNAIEAQVTRNISGAQQKAMTKSLREIVTAIESSGS